MRLRDGETKVQCTGCGSTVASADAAKGALAAGARSGGEKTRQVVLSLSLGVAAAGLATMATLRRHGPPDRGAAPAPTPIYTAPPVAPVGPTPEGELAWEANARSPVIAAINGDAVEDIVGFFRVWDGLSAWIAYAGAFDGATLKPLWRSEPIDPQIIKQPGVVPLAVVVGGRVVVADTSPTLRVFDLVSGEKQVTLKLTGAVQDICRAPDQPNRVWIHVVGGGDTTLDVLASKAELAPRPKWCPVPPYQVEPPPPTQRKPTPEELAAAARRKVELTACTELFDNGLVARAACRPPATSKGEEGFVPAYELSDGTLSVALGTKESKPFARSRVAASPWAHDFVVDGTMAKDAAPAVAELGFGRLYAVYERVYFDARLAAVDARTGEALWDAPLVGSLPRTDGNGRGEARGLVTTASRVYVTRAGGGLDIFDAAAGKPVGTIGKQ